jgi:hypothetical protein
MPAGDGAGGLVVKEATIWGTGVVVVVGSAGVREALLDALAGPRFAARAVRFDEARSAVAGAPDTAVVIEAGPDGRGLELVQALRVAPETSILSLVIVTAAPTLRLPAQVHGSVHQVLSLPVDPASLYSGIDGALALQHEAARLQAQGAAQDAAVRQATDVLIEAEPALLMDWLAAMRAETAFAQRPDVADEAVVDQLPQVVHGLLLMLRHDEPADLLSENEPLVALIRKHARGHHDHGIPAESIVREYQVLGALAAVRLRARLAADAALRALDELHALNEAAIRLTVRERVRLTQSGGPPQASRS